MSGEMFTEFARRKRYVIGTWNHIRAKECWDAATAAAQSRQASAQGGERVETGLRAAATLAYKALCEESAAYDDPIAHVEEAIAALQTALATPPNAPQDGLVGDAERRYEFLRQDAGIRDGRPFIAISEAGAISQWTGVFADEKIDTAIRAGRKG